VNKFYERAITAISAKFPEWKGLFLVEGNQNNPETDPEPGSPDDYPFWWGGKLNRKEWQHGQAGNRKTLIVVIKTKPTKWCAVLMNSINK